MTVEPTTEILVTKIPVYVLEALREKGLRSRPRRLRLEQIRYELIRAADRYLAQRQKRQAPPPPQESDNA